MMPPIGTLKSRGWGWGGEGCLDLILGWACVCLELPVGEGAVGVGGTQSTTGEEIQEGERGVPAMVASMRRENDGARRRSWGHGAAFYGMAWHGMVHAR